LAAFADSSLTETVPTKVTALGMICGALPDWAMAVA
jgi:CRISPR-associated Cas5-like protein